MLAVAVQVLAISCWFSVSVVVPTLRARWGLSTGQASWLTSAVQLGFAGGAVVSAALRLADRVAPRVLVPICSLLAAAVTCLPAVAGLGYGGTLATRALCGALLAGVYPPGLRWVTSWFRERRGTAAAAVVAALTLGTASPHLGRTVSGLDWRLVLAGASAAAVLAAGLGLLARQGPHVVPAGPLRPEAVWWLFRDRRQRLASVAYLGHMWELYGAWVWLPSLLALLRGAHRGSGLVLTPAWGPFVLIGLAGALGCLAGGVLADRFGKARVAGAAVGVSGVCCLLTPALPVLPGALVALVLLVWGAAIIADSPLYSALLGDLADQADRAAIGTALTTQLALGYAVSVVTITGLPALAAAFGWRWAFLPLALGPLLSVVALARLRRSR